MIEQFSKQQFEQALSKVGTWKSLGMDAGEQVYLVPIDERVGIVIRSAVDESGYAKGTGEDSIRMWLVDRKTDVPIGKGAQRWVTRQPGWATRIEQKVALLKEWRRIAGDCPECHNPKICLLSRTEKNPNRPFAACGNRAHRSFTWLPEFVEVKINLGIAVPDEPLFSSESNNEKTNTIGDDGSSGAVQESDNPLSFLAKVETVAVQVKPARIWSKYQNDIFDFVDGDNGNAVVEAVAGSGKTTTLVEALNHTPNNAEVAFLAFNKHIATELAERAPSHVHVSTLHSLGYGNAKKQLGANLKVNEHKLWDLFDTMDPWGEHKELKPVAAHIVDLLKATLREPNEDNIAYIVDRYNIEMNGDSGKIIEFAQELYRKSIAVKDTLDFEDMIFWSAQGEIACQQFDVILGDEVQDWNQAQIQMVLKSVKPGGRVIAVGDRWQSIYGFRGADTDAIPNLIDALEAKTLPLSISYRCPKSAIRMAQQLVPQIEWREDAPEGLVATVPQLVNMRAGDMVLCRTNAPLVKPCMDLIRNRIKATIRGRDIGTGLVSMLKRGEKRAISSQLSAVYGYLEKYVAQESVKLNAAHKETRALALQDQFDTLIALGDGCNTVGQVIRNIGEVFSNDKAAVTFSSAHRAKGLEAERVFILKPELMPFAKATKDWEMQQEKNLMYVAWTRTKDQLYFVAGE